MPRVTEILAPWSNFDGVPPEVLEAAADRGQRVHTACHAYVMGLFDNPGEDAQGYVDGFKAWFDRRVDDVFGAEIELKSQSGFDCFSGVVGHPDLIVKMKGEETLTLVDIKTPATLLRIWNVQLAAYKALSFKNGIDIDRMAILRLKPDGKSIFTEVKDDSGHYINGFIKAYDAWKFFHNLKGEYHV